MIRPHLPELKHLVIATGAAIVIGWTMIEGLKIHRWAARYVPWLIGYDGIACIVGLAVGLAIVATWWR